MVGGNNKGKKVAKDSGRQSKKRKQPLAMPPVKGKGKGDTITHIPNPEDPKRWALFGSRRILSERGINLPMFDNTFIPGAGAPVMVQERPVRVTTELINQWFDTPRDLEHEHFEPYNAMLTTNLRINGDPAWNDYRHPLQHSQLNLDTGFWYVFFLFSLASTTHRTDLRNDLRMDIDQIIMNHIFRVGHSSNGPLPFLGLITHFCEMAGIDVYGGAWTIFPPMVDMGRRVYNDLAKRRGLKVLGDVSDEEDNENNEDDPDFEEQDFEGDLDVEPMVQSKLT
ncbi:hypothetical protein Ddye_019811 [Dipteronia dyeriana]|uniref:Putative plant transposon protein domain-containing protein n=1 Tax=Dipteronia dyeriana TaxID=168575 RepID=A0AAD9TYY0_9ROSI|nr:hypothetical protein Ddye_019811 [Dipteronia dyeriana]